MKKIISLCVLVCLCTVAMAQTITIKDIETDAPLEAATLSSGYPQAFATTDANGQVDISAFKGAGAIEIRMLGYQIMHVTYDALASGNGTVYLTPKTFTIGKTVISNTRWKQNSRDIPSRIATIQKTEVELQNPQTAADLLGLSGEVFIQKSQQGGGSPMIRGFATNRLIYTVDGVRMNTAIFRGGNIQNVISLDPFAIESTEILFGPGSVVYGSDAIGGVMSFTTLTPEFGHVGAPLVKGNMFTRSATANNERTYHFDLNLGFDRWAFVTSFSSNQYDDLRMGTNGPDDYLRHHYVQRIDSVDRVITNEDPLVQTPSGYNQMNLMQKVRYNAGEHWDLQYGFHYSETSEYARYDRHQRMRNGLPRYAEWSYGPQKWMMNNLNITYDRGNTLFDQMTIRLAQQSFEESRIERSLNRDTRSTRIEQVEAYSTNVDFIKTIGDKGILFYGIEGVVNDVTSTGIDEDITTGMEQPGPSRYPQSQWSTYSAYVDYQHDVTDKFLLQGGLRYSQFMLDADFDTTFYPFPFTEASLNNSATTGSFGFVYQPSSKWIVSGNVATAFRAPNVDDVGKVFDSEPGAVVIPNPDLEAEYAYNADIDVAKIFGDVLKVDATAFYTNLENALVRRNYTLNGMDSIMYDGVLSQVQAIQNAAVTRVYGIQAGLEVKLGKGLRFSTNYNYQKGEEELDDETVSPSRHAAPWFGKSAFDYKHGSLRLQLYAMYSGERKFEDMPEDEKGKTEIYALDENGNPYSPGWYTINLKANYKFDKNFSIGAGLENITDQRYRPYSSGLSAAGRNLILSLKASF